MIVPIGDIDLVVLAHCETRGHIQLAVATAWGAKFSNKIPLQVENLNTIVILIQRIQFLVGTDRQCTHPIELPITAARRAEFFQKLVIGIIFSDFSHVKIRQKSVSPRIYGNSVDRCRVHTALSSPCSNKITRGINDIDPIV